MEQQEIQFLIFAISTVIFLMILVIFGIVGIVQRKKTQLLLEKERSRKKYEEELLKSRIEISNQSLQNIGWELHDNIGQILSVASLQTKKLLSKDQVEKQELKELGNLIGMSLREIRSLSKTLNHEVLGKLGLIKALQLEMDRLERLNILDCHFEYPAAIDLSEDQTVLLFRILQEFISNVVKHAQASQLSIQIERHIAALNIVAQDNGRGYNTKEVTSSSGLINMASRARIMNADFEISSVIGQGTKLEIKIVQTNELNV